MSRLTPNQLDEYLPFLLARDGYFCNICRKTIEEILQIRKKHEDITGIRYGTRALVIEHKNNNKNQIDDDNGIYAGNIQLACYSCNNWKSFHVDNSQSYERPLTREKTDTLRFEPTYHRNVHKFLIENDHICFIELKMAGKKFSEGANEVTCIRYFNSQRVTEANKNGRYKIFAYNCGSDNCNGTHVCLRGIIPIKLLENDAIKLMNIWQVEYGLNMSETDRNQWAMRWENMNKRNYPPFSEFYQQNSTLLNQFPEVNLELFLNKKK